MNPPKPKLTWVNVTSLDFISDIVILRGREDIRDKPWAQPLFRNAIRAWSKLQRAHEEIEIIAIEATRVWTFIDKEEAHLNNIFDATRPANPILTAYISSTFQYRLNVNTHLRTKLTLLAKQRHYIVRYRAGTLLPSMQPDAASTETSSHEANELVGDGHQVVNNSNNEVEDNFQGPQTPDLEDENDDDIADNGDYLHVIGRVASALETMDMNLM